MLHIHHTFIGLLLNVILFFKHFDMLSKVSHVIENSFICDLAIVRLKIKKNGRRKVKKKQYTTKKIYLISVFIY